MLRYERYSFQYAGAQAPALKEIDLYLPRASWLWLTGPAGSGKTSLLAALQPELRAEGREQGRLFYQDKEIKVWTHRDRLASIGSLGPPIGLGFAAMKAREVIQMSAKNLDWSESAIRSRLADLAHIFALEGILDRSMAELSQGQAQRVDLAAAIFLKPELVLLDDAFDDLDPQRRKDIWRFIKSLQEDEGLTLITANQDGDMLAFADSIVCLKDGEKVFEGTPQKAFSFFRAEEEGLYPMAEIPSLASRILGSEEALPLTVCEARPLADRELRVEELQSPSVQREEVLRFERLRFRYDRNHPLLEDVSYGLHHRDRAYLFGANGAGKSTLLSLGAGFLKAWEGRVFRRDDKPGYFGGAAAANFRMDDCQLLIHRRLESIDHDAEERALGLGRALDVLDFRGHPFDLSAGMQQRLALWLVLARPAGLYLLDEPTAHLDPKALRALEEILAGPEMEGRAVLMAGHDLSFAAQTCQRAAILFDGHITGDMDILSFFANHQAYTTDTHRILGRSYPGVIRPDQVRGPR